MSTTTFVYSYFEDTPTFDEVNEEISKIVGLDEIKSQLEVIVKRVIAVEKSACLGNRIVPPKPFHIVFLGNTGTGKSTVARILGKVFYLAGGLASYTVTEVQGLKGSVEKIRAAEGGVLLVDIERSEYKSEVVDELISIMDGGETLIIFAGQRGPINRCMGSNKEMYKRLSVTLNFDDLSCEELAMIIIARMDDQAEDSTVYGLKFHPSCNVEAVGEIIRNETSEELRKMMNAHLVEVFLDRAQKNLVSRFGPEADTTDDQSTITLVDLKAGIRCASEAYNKLLFL